MVRDLPMADPSVVVVWTNRLCRYPETGCEVGHVVRSLIALSPGRRSANEVKPRSPAAQAGEQSAAPMMCQFEVGWHAAMTAERDHAQLRVDHMARLRVPGAIGMDETPFLASAVMSILVCS
jgi:hypothetical protein